MTSGRIIFLAKLAFSAGLVWYLAGKFNLQQALMQLGNLTQGWMFLIVGAFYAQLAIAAMRFREFLQVYGVGYGFAQSVDATLIGYFFSQTFISFVGGDAMRVARTSRSGVPIKIVAKAVILDRTSGFASQVALMLLVLPFALPRITDPAMRYSLVLLVGGALAGGLAVLVATRLPGAIRKFRIFDIIADVAGRVLRRITTRRGLTAFFGYSLLIALCNSLLYFFIASALGSNLPLVDCLVLLPPVFFMSMLPISVSGWGIREGTTIVALGIAGVPAPEALAISVAYGVSLILISLPGGVLWLFFARKRPVATREINDAENNV